MRVIKSHPLLKLLNSYLIDSSQPSNLSYLWNFGSLLAFCLVIQIITGVTLAMHYNPSALEAFNSVEHIMRDVNNGWLIRYLHSNTASAFFFIVYLHIGRGLYYGSYRAPRTLVWTIGTVIFILMIATAFLGYVLPYGQMSLWGATVITNLMSAIPWVGQDIVEFIWGGFSVNNATLNRFFALHFVLPFVLAALALMHLIALHDSAGSGNPSGISGNYDRLPFSPYFIFKDLITIFTLILVLSVFVFFMPNLLGDSENYVMANPMQTPPAIVPEWYLLPFYAILRSIPNKLLGVIAMFSAILILLVMPFTDLSRYRGIQFRPLSKAAFFVFVGNFLVLMQLGAKHVESPFIEFGQLSTVIYFAHFLIIVPMFSLLENTLIELAIKENETATINNVFTGLEIQIASLAYLLKNKEKKNIFTSIKQEIVRLKKRISSLEREEREKYFTLAEEIAKEKKRLYSEFTEDQLAKLEKYFTNTVNDLARSEYFLYKKIENMASYKYDMTKLPKHIVSLEDLLDRIDGRIGRLSLKGLVYYLRYIELEITIIEKKIARIVSRRKEKEEKDANMLSSEIIKPNKLTLSVLLIMLFGYHLDQIFVESWLESACVLCDAPRPWGIYFQDSATPQMEGIVELHDNILFYLVIILFGVGWMLVTTVKDYTNTVSPISRKNLSHGTLVELIWTITPSLILILIAFPSFKLLYLMDEVSDPSMAVLAEGHQWYWSYQYPDFLNNDEEFIEFDSYLIPESDLEDGALRMLEVDNRVIIPELTHVRFIVTGADVIHSFACPALGIKCDAYPGRLNQVSVLINREGVFYGQCSEICGILHSSMPIVIESVSIEKFISWLEQQ